MRNKVRTIPTGGRRANRPRTDMNEKLWLNVMSLGVNIACILWSSLGFRTRKSALLTFWINMAALELTLFNILWNTYDLLYIPPEG